MVLNGLPLAVADPWYSTPQNTALVVNSQNHPLLENDWDPEGSMLSASVVTNPTTGSLSNFNASAGTFTYTPNGGFSGVDSFTYKVNDGTSDSPVVTASIAVGGHFGPRTNGEESGRLDGEQQVADELPTRLAANTAAVPFSASGLTGDLEYMQTLTPGLRLLYNSGTFARPIVVLETFPTPLNSVPDEIKAQLTFNGTAATNYSYNTTGLQAGQALRFARKRTPVLWLPAGTPTASRLPCASVPIVGKGRIGSGSCRDSACDTAFCATMGEGVPRARRRSTGCEEACLGPRVDFPTTNAVSCQKFSTRELRNKALRRIFGPHVASGT